MSPDRVFVKKLKEFDPRLEVVWGRFSNKWRILRNNPSGAKTLVMVVKNDDDTYRPLDERTLLHLHMHDLHAVGIDAFLEYFDQQNDRVKKDLDAKRLQSIEVMADQYYDKLKKTTDSMGLNRSSFTSDQLRDLDKKLEGSPDA